MYHRTGKGEKEKRTERSGHDKIEKYAQFTDLMDCCAYFNALNN
jgi:hypothetical protein